jgi:rod shape determining protein RodA
MIDRRLLKNFDWSILFVAVALSFIGIMTIYSATRPVLDAEQQSYYLRQFYWLGLSLIGFVVVVSIDYRWYVKFAYVLFVLGIVLLIAVLLVGKKGMGAQRWIPLGFMSFQPSEFFKLFFVFALSRYLSGNDHIATLDLKELTKMILIFFVVPSVLILKQPHLGTVIILFLVFAFMVMVAGTRKKIIVVVVIIGIISLPFIGNILWGGLKGYQKQRIIAFINPYADQYGVGYHIHQSKVSIGSGGFRGKGYLKGTQGPLRFLPERHTDFVFSVFAEEWGMSGSFVLFILYFYLIMKGFDTVRKARDPTGRYLALGVTFVFSLYFFINVGMALGMVPVVGVPMPFMSYGGTALLSNFLFIGILVNVRMRRFPVFY